jgi:polyisoprenoid-binding protein YceI
MPRIFAVLLLVCGIATAAVARGFGVRTYAIDHVRSHATIAVGKSGLLSFAAGHTHEVVAPEIAGSITVDLTEPSRSTVQVTIDASALKVTGKNEPPNDLPKVQQTMSGEKVLDVRRYPTIDFASTSISLKSRAGTKLDVIATGQLTLHDVTRSVSVPVTADVGATELTATGHFLVKQTDYGITPVSVGGVVSVKDVLDVSFTIVGR